jgi:hypothetical protein
LFQRNLRPISVVHTLAHAQGCLLFVMQLIVDSTAKGHLNRKERSGTQGFPEKYPRLSVFIRG